jgi:CheY-like chemotaxis protein
MMRCRHILFADDEGGFRFSASVALRSAGYRVTTAHDGLEALERAVESRASGNPVQILVTDEQMPGMTGTELVRALHDRGFEFPVVIVTGWAGSPAGRSLHGPGIREVVEKPIGPEDLVACVERVLGVSREGAA